MINTALNPLIKDVKHEIPEKDLKKYVVRLRQYTTNNDEIFELIKEDYHDDFSDEEIHKLMTEAY